MLNLGAPELGVLFVVGLLLAGPDRIPSIVRDVGRGVRGFRSGVQQMSVQLREETGLDVDELRALHPKRIFDEVTQSEPTPRTNTISNTTSDRQPEREGRDGVIN